MDYAERAERGARLLDEKRPGWWREINLEGLDMESICNCVLGQLWELYGTGCAVLGLSPDQSVGHGFSLGITSSMSNYQAMYDRLDIYWRREIEYRLLSDVAATELAVTADQRMDEQPSFDDVRSRLVGA